jgi:hypothetical protein
MPPPPPISVIKNNNCFDMVQIMKNCMKTAMNLNVNVISMQKNYAHPIYYPIEEIRECVFLNRFETKEKIKVDITDKMNTQIHYTVTYDNINNKIHLQL